jgi:ligand-binding sensor domain-containing protein/signal transduction histidine kinase
MKRKLWSINSNTFLKRTKSRRWQRACLSAVLPLLCCVTSSSALGPNKTLSQYILDKWDIDQGFPGGSVSAFAQTPDGYLWIGTDKGLVRFDGINFVLFVNSDSSRIPFGPVLGLAVDVNGNLWIRLEGSRLLRYRDGKFQDVSLNLREQETDITAMSLGKDGHLLLSGLKNGVVREGNGFEARSPIEVLPRLIISLAQMPDGKIWLGTREQGVFSLEHERVFGFLTNLPDKKINCLLAMNDRDLWIGTDNGLVRSNGANSPTAGTLTVLGNTQVLTITRDRDSNIWVGTSEGLFRVNANGVSSFDSPQQQPEKAVTALFEDREGNFWVGTTSGVQRLRDSIFTTYSHSNGLPSDSNGPLYVDSEARTWFSPTDGGLYRLKDGRVERINAAGLHRDVLYSIDGRKGELWIGRREGLTRLRYTDSSYTAKTYTQADGLAQNSVYAVHQSRDGSVWAGTLSAGVSQFKNDTFTTYTTTNGLASNTVSSIAESADGTMWFGTPNGLSSLAQGHWRSYTTQDGLPPGNVNSLLQDPTGTIWIGTDNGLAFIRSGIVQSLADVPDALREPIFGIEDDRTGSLWISTAKHILRVEREKLLRQPLAASDLREYGLSDGLLSSQGIKRQKSVTADFLGRIWFSTNRGLSFVDPASAKFRSAPALVRVNELYADGRQIKLAPPDIRVPAPHHRITLAYTGLSLAVPTRVRFKYRLDGFDQHWTEPTSSREATYTNLEPGHYVFRVIAGNSEGVWNSAEATVPFEIEATLWQTTWFQLCVVLIIVLALVAFSRLRMRKLGGQLKLRFEERLAERTRIAQELHDTLLQGVISASMQLHVVADQLSANSTAKPAVDRILSLMGRVVEEGRNAVDGLRARPSESLDLAEAFSEISREFANEDLDKEVGLHVTVEGQPRLLHPIIRNDIYSIGREALINAFRHAQANNIEVELGYASYGLRILIRDDGIGFDSKILRFGRHGHWGLSGMRERAKRIGARLKLFSRPAAGTEVELIVPGQIAFVPTSSSGTSNWFSRLSASWKHLIERHPNESER